MYLSACKNRFGSAVLACPYASIDWQQLVYETASVQEQVCRQLWKSYRFCANIHRGFLSCLGRLLDNNFYAYLLNFIFKLDN